MKKFFFLFALFPCLFLFVAVAPRAHAAVSLIQVATDTFTTTKVAANFSVSTKVGDAIILGEIGPNGTPVATVTDNKGDKFNKAISVTGSLSGQDLEIWYTTSTVGGVTVVSSSISGGTLTTWAYEVSGMNTSTMLDVTATSSQAVSSSTCSGPILNTNSANEFLLSLCASSAGTITNIQSGSTWTDDNPEEGDSSGHFVASSTGSYQAQWAMNPSGTSLSIGVGFAGVSPPAQTTGAPTSMFKILFGRLRILLGRVRIAP